MQVTETSGPMISPNAKELATVAKANAESATRMNTASVRGVYYRANRAVIRKRAATRYVADPDKVKTANAAFAATIIQSVKVYVIHLKLFRSDDNLAVH